MHPLSLFGSANLVVPFHAVPSAAWFRRALDALSRFYRFVPLAALEPYFDGGQPLRNVCHVCFDDGDRSFYDEAWPVLQERGIPATLFVSPKVISEGRNYWFQEAAFLRRRLGDEALREAFAESLGCPREALRPFAVFSILLSLPLAEIRRLLAQVMDRHGLRLTQHCNLSLEQLLDVSRSGLVTVGGHTMNHPVLANEAPAAAEMEIRESLRLLQELLDQPVRYFAYPNGTPGLDFTAREQALLRACGVRLAVSTQPGFFHRGTDPLAIPRGGCPSLEGESWVRTLGRLALLPFWDPVRDGLAGRTADTEPAQRRRLRPVLSAGQGRRDEADLLP